MVNNGGAVLIHSRRGMNRAVVLAIAYLMDKYSWTLEKAGRYYKSKVHKEDLYQIKDYFLNQLKEYEEYLKLEEKRSLTTDFIFDDQVNTEEQMLVNTWINSQSKMQDRISLSKDTSTGLGKVNTAKSQKKKKLVWAVQVANLIPFKENLNLDLNRLKARANKGIKNHQQGRNLDSRIKNYLKGTTPKRGSTPAKMCNGLGKRIKNLKNILSQNRKSKPNRLNSLTPQGYGNKLDVPGKKGRKINRSMNSLKDSSKDIDFLDKNKRSKTPAKISLKEKKKNVDTSEIKKMEKLIKSIEQRNKKYLGSQNNFNSESRFNSNYADRKMINSVSTHIKPFTPSKPAQESYRSGSVMANKGEGKSQNLTPVTSEATTRVKTESDEKAKQIMEAASINNNLGDQIKKRIQSRSRSKRKEKTQQSNYEVKPDDKSPVAQPMTSGIGESNDEYNFLQTYNEVKRTGSTKPNYYYQKGDSYLTSVVKNNKSSKSKMIKVKIEDAYKFVSPRTTRGLKMVPKVPQREGSSNFNPASFTRKNTYEIKKHQSGSNHHQMITSDPKIKILGDTKKLNNNSLQIPKGDRRIKTSRSPRKTRNTTKISAKTPKSVLNNILITGQSRRQSVAKSQKTSSRYKRSSVAVS